MSNTFIDPDDIEEYYDVNGDYLDATRIQIQLKSPVTFEQAKQSIIQNQLLREKLEELIGNIDVSELDSKTVDILNEINTITKETNGCVEK